MFRSHLNEKVKESERKALFQQVVPSSVINKRGLEAKNINTENFTASSHKLSKISEGLINSDERLMT